MMHKRIGIIGGMSPESTAEYYAYITRTYTQRFGDHSYPEILIYSVSFQPYIDWPGSGRWDLVAAGLADAARRLESAGADFVVIATNTMHKVVGEVQAAVNVPVLSLLDATAEMILREGLSVVGLLGTRFTMEDSFYSDALSPRGVSLIVPDREDRAFVNDVIYGELVAGEIREESRQGFISIVSRLKGRGAQGVIMGCTEIPLLLANASVGIPLFDTTAIHAEAVLQYAVSSVGDSEVG
jgi:aspartate racemase